MTGVGPIGGLGRYTATHFRVVLIVRRLIAVVLGFFAPRVATALSGGGWDERTLRAGAARVQSVSLLALEPVRASRHTPARIWVVAPWRRFPARGLGGGFTNTPITSIERTHACPRTCTADS